MSLAPDPLKVYRHAREVGDRGLADALARRLFPWRRQSLEPGQPAQPGPRRTVRRLMERLFTP